MGDSRIGQADKAKGDVEAEAAMAVFQEALSAWFGPNGQAKDPDNVTKPEKITYPDGSTRQFGYDDAGNLTAVKESGKNGARRSARDGYWYTPVKVHQFDLDYYETVPSDTQRQVSADGTYVLKDSTGITRTYKSDGTKWVGDFELSTIRAFLQNRSRVSQLYQQHAGHIDLDGDGLLSKKEIQSAANDPWAKGGDVKLLATGMSQIFNTLSFLSRDSGHDGKAISKSDMDWFKRASEFGDRGFSDKFRNPGLVAGPIGALIWNHVEGYGDERERLETLSPRLDKAIDRAIKRVAEASDFAST